MYGKNGATEVKREICGMNLIKMRSLFDAQRKFNDDNYELIDTPKEI